MKTSSLTPEQKIAEACGWTFITSDGVGIPPNGIPFDAREVPDYLNDLNAMHEAEKCLSRVAYWNYADLYLKQVVWKDGAPGTAYQCATAAQRAEAFLLTIEATNSVSTGS